MKRSGPLKRSTPLKSGKGLGGGSALKRTGLKAGKVPKARSNKRAQFMKEDRAPLVRALVDAGVPCEVSPVFERFGIPHDCTRQISGMHERRKRSAGGSLINRANLLASCSPCNEQIEAMAGPVRELTGDLLVVRSGDPEWDELGARNDP